MQVYKETAVKIIYRENGILKVQEYAVDWIERKGFDWNVHANLPKGTPFWVLSDEDCAALEGVPIEHYDEVLSLGEPDGVSIGQEAYEEAHPETADSTPEKSEYEVEGFNAVED